MHKKTCNPYDKFKYIIEKYKLSFMGRDYKRF